MIGKSFPMKRELLCVHERRVSKHLLIQRYLILRRSVQYTEKTGIPIAAYWQRGLYKEL